MGDKIEKIKEYYGKILKGRGDLKTSACCCCDDSAPSRFRDILSQIDDEILDRSYGCGSPIPMEINGRVVLDLGCGTGRDSYLLSSLVGPDGHVIGIDMTDEQLEVAQRHLKPQMMRFGYSEPNIEFRKGYIEDLAAAGIADNSVDIVISNCVINLSPDKRSVFSEIFRALKPGGELYFSDVFTGRRVPEHLSSDPVLYGECLSGALYVEDFSRLLREAGCLDYRVASKTRLTLGSSEIEARIGMVDFYSMTVRAFKLDTLEDICEDYGQVAVYLGTIPESPHSFLLDDHHLFVAGKPALVCGNTAAMLGDTRFARHFKITGGREVHYGPFNCAPASYHAGNGEGHGGSCC